MSINLNTIRECFEGAIPSVLATCSLDGTPNVVYISQVEFIDADHIALTFQFFNKTRRNILENPFCCLRTISPYNGNTYELQLRYLRTENKGPIFEKMKAKLSGIASHTGMTDIFKLQGSDVYQVLTAEQVSALPTPRPSQLPPVNYHPKVNLFAKTIAQCDEFDALVETSLQLFEQEFAVTHCMFFILDEQTANLFNCGSLGYDQSGVGTEITLGDGVIGVAAQEKTVIRISHMTSEYGYNYAIREQIKSNTQLTLNKTIPFPGLANSRSQMAVPLTYKQKALGVIYFESLQDLAFSYDHENIFETLGILIAAQIQLLNEKSISPNEPQIENAPYPETTCTHAVTNTVDFYPLDQSIFINNEYIIKGVAGAILWLLLNENKTLNKIHFSNRELRLNKTLGLPEVADNLEARLTLLHKRLIEKNAPVDIQKCGRGRLALHIHAPFHLTQKN